MAFAFAPISQEADVVLGGGHFDADALDDLALVREAQDEIRRVVDSGQEMGGQSIVSLRKCDTDYETEATNWFDEVLQKLRSGGGPGPAPVTTVRKTTGKKLYAGNVLTHVNLNDGVIEGLRCRGEAAFSVQYHPEAGPGPHDARYLFEQFRQLMTGEATGAA